MVIHLPATNDPVIAALGLAAAAVTLWLMFRVLRAGKPRPGLAMFARPFAVVVILLCAACLAATIVGLRDLQAKPGMDPTGVVVVALGAVFFLWGSFHAMTLRLEWDEAGFRLNRFLRPPLAARWEDVEGVALARNAVVVRLRSGKPVGLSRYLVGLQAFVDEANRRSKPG